MYLYCKGSGANTKEFVSSGRFAVLKESKVLDYMISSFELKGKSYFNLRNKLLNAEIIVKDIFENGYEFNASSAISTVILGCTSNENAIRKMTLVYP